MSDEPIDADYEAALAEQQPERTDDDLLREIVVTASRAGQSTGGLTPDAALHRVEGLARSLLLRRIGRQADTVGRLGDALMMLREAYEIPVGVDLGTNPPTMHAVARVQTEVARVRVEALEAALRALLERHEAGSYSREEVVCNSCSARAARDPDTGTHAPFEHRPRCIYGIARAVIGAAAVADVPFLLRRRTDAEPSL